MITQVKNLVKAAGGGRYSKIKVTGLAAPLGVKLNGWVISADVQFYILFLFPSDLHQEKQNQTFFSGIWQ